QRKLSEPRFFKFLLPLRGIFASRDKVTELEQLVAQLRKERAHLRSAMRSSGNLHSAALAEKLEAILQSTSWKLTSPIRFLGHSAPFLARIGRELMELLSPADAECPAPKKTEKPSSKINKPSSKIESQILQETPPNAVVSELSALQRFAQLH